MNELSPRAKAMLQLASETEAPLAGTQERLERRLARRIAAGAALVAAGSSLSKSATGAALVFLKTAAVVSVGAVAAVVSVQALTPSPRAPATETVPAQATRARAARAVLARSVAVLPSTESETEIDDGRPVAEAAIGEPGAVPGAALASAAEVRRETAPPNGAPRAVAARVAAAAHGARAAPPSLAANAPRGVSRVNAPERASGVASTARVPPGPAVGDFGAAGRDDSLAALSAPADPLQAEAQALRGIQLALRGGNGSLALQLLGESARQFSGGVLQQERAAARVQALCLVGQGESARSAALAFTARWPGSPLRARVESACR